MGKTFSKKVEKRFDWKRDRQNKRRDKDIARGRYVGKRVERAKGAQDESAR